MPEGMELSFEYPSKIASMLINDEVDLGLVPVAVIPNLKEYHIVSDYCIGAEGEVASVCLFSDVKLENIKTLYLDYQSRTSVALLKILMKRYFKISPEIIESSSGYEAKIKDDVAGLVIGDRAFAQRKKSKYIYDLSLAWQEMTGLPFVFAAWISNKILPDDFIKSFNEASAFGIENIGFGNLRILRVDFNWRGNYLENLNAKKFGIKFGFQYYF